MRRTTQVVTMLLAALLVTPGWAAEDRPVVAMPDIEQGGQARGSVPIDIVWKPADDGIAVVKLDVYIDETPVITFDLQPRMRHVQYNWDTTTWPEGKHNLVVRVQDAKGRERSFRTFIYVRNQSAATHLPTNRAGTVEVEDLDGVPDNQITGRALIRVRVNPEVGAKWVVLFLNGKFIAMMNYPPYQLLLDPARRNLKDGPYVIQARVIQPDNTELYPDPVNVVLNANGTYTRVQPPVGVQRPSAVPAAPVPNVVPDPGLTVPRPAASHETPPPAATIDIRGPQPMQAGSPLRVQTGGDGAPVVGRRGTLQIPGTTEAVSLPGTLDAGSGKPGVVPGQSPSPNKYIVGPTRVQRRMGPLMPPRPGVGEVASAGVRDSVQFARSANAGATSSHVATPAELSRRRPPRTSSSTVAVGPPAAAMGTLDLPAAGSRQAAVSLPPALQLHPRTGAGNLTTAPGSVSIATTTLGAGQPQAAATRSGIPAATQRSLPVTGAGPAAEITVQPALVAGAGQPTGAAPAGPWLPRRKAMTSVGTARTGTVGETTAAAGRVAGADGRPVTTMPGRRQLITAPSEVGPTTAGGDFAETTVLEPGRGVVRPVVTSLPSRMGPQALPSIGRAPETTAVPGRVRVPTRLAPPLAGAQTLDRGPQTALPGSPRPAAPQAAVRTAPRSIGRLHQVKRGDTLMSLSRQYKVDPDAIARVNGLKDRNLIVVGQKLIIPRFGGLTVNGTKVMTDVAPLQQRQGLATTPFRHVVEALGGSVTWIGPTKQVQATTAERGQIMINIGSNAAQVNDEQVLMDLAAYLEQDRAMVAVKFLSNALDVTVEMDPESGNIMVRSNH